MARTDLDHRSGKILPRVTAKYCSTAKISGIMAENREHAKPKKGIRESVLEIYRNEGILAAYMALQAHNKKIGSPVYTRESLEQWIAEDARKRGYNKDDGFDR